MIEITDVKIYGLCSKHQTKDHPVPKNKFGKTYDDKDIECVGCDIWTPNDPRGVRWQ